LIACVFLVPIALSAQCPEQQFLWKRIEELRASSIPAKEMLPELQSYLTKINGCSYRNDSTQAALLGLMAGLYFEEKDYLKSIQYRRQAIDIINAPANKKAVKFNALPKLYYGLSLAYDSLDNFPEKMKALDSCSTIAIRINYVDWNSLNAIYTFIMYYFDIGDYKRCIDYAIRCQSLGKQYKINSTPQEQLVGEYFISSSLVWQVIALMKLKNFTEAEKLLANKVSEFKTMGLTNYLGTTYTQLAEVQLNKGDYYKALSFYKLALNYDQKAGNAFSCKQTLKDIGYSIYFSHFNDNDKAMAYYKKALGVVIRDKMLTSEDASESLDIYTKIGDLYTRQKRFDSAYHFFQLAFDQIRPGINETGILHSSPDEIRRIKKIQYLTRLLLDKGITILQQFKDQRNPNGMQQAIAVFKITDQFLDRVRNEQRDPQSKLIWRSDSRRLYENAIEACYLAKDYKNTFYFFEKSRAVLLSDQLNEQHWMKQKDIRLQTQLKKNILLMEREYAAANKSSSHSIQLQNDLFSKKQQLDHLQQTIRTSNPLYYQSFLDTGFITLQDVQNNILNNHQAVIELFAGDSSVFILVITPKNIQLQKIARLPFEEVSQSFIKYISNPALLNKNYTVFIETSRQFYQFLFQNIDLPKGRIIISPDGQYFPFEALITSKKQQPLSYFIEDYAVSYTYSARYLINLFGSSSASESSMFMGMAPVQYASNLGLPALPGSNQSLQRLDNRFRNAQCLIGEKASKNNFLQQFYHFKIIQLYTHATDSGNNGEPLIYFQDSTLLLSDLLYENRPATRLIVLSACKTASGKIYQGEGVFSFNRGFAALGIPSSVTNLWQVDNESTYKLTELFYKWLAKGLPLDVALQKAKLEFIHTATKERKLPYFWAAPVLTGQSDSIGIEKKFSWIWPAGLLSILLLSAWGIRKWIRKDQFIYNK
jgi:CHAT domain-containing protein